MIVNHATGRQRGDSGRPFGKSKNSKTIRVTKFEPESQTESQAATSPWGSEPGRVARAYTAYSPQRLVSDPLRPKRQKIQPIELIGLREAMSAPTRVKAMKRRTKPISIIHGSVSSTVEVERFKDWRNKAATKEDSEIAPRPQASQAARASMSRLLRKIVLEELSGFMRVRYLAMEHSNREKNTKSTPYLTSYIYYLTTASEAGR